MRRDYTGVVRETEWTGRNWRGQRYESKGEMVGESHRVDVSRWTSDDPTVRRYGTRIVEEIEIIGEEV